MLFSLFWAGALAANYTDVTLDGFNAKSLAGYIDVTHGSLFYWLVKQTECACTAPVIIWLNGGPGSASTAAALFENGPAIVQSDGSLSDTAGTSWNNFANMVYLDQPVGAGYSMATDQNVSNTDTAAGDFIEFIKAFYEKFPRLKDNPLHIAGESYAGRYIPTFVEQYMADADRPRDINSIMLGNAVVQFSDQKWSVPDMYCGKGGVAAVLDNTTCTKLETSRDTCYNSLLPCITAQDVNECANNDYDYCYDIESAPTYYHNTGGNPYHLGVQCEESETGLCYKTPDYVQDYLNSTSVKEALGVDTSVNFDLTGAVVNDNWDYLDQFWDGASQVASLLDSGLNTLVYSGDQDGIAPWLGSQEWTRSMTWSGSDDFGSSAANPTAYSVSGTQAGDVSSGAGSSGALTFFRVFGSGHMVPFDVPAVAFQMAKDWVYKQELV